MFHKFRIQVFKIGELRKKENERRRISNETSYKFVYVIKKLTSAILA